MQVGARPCIALLCGSPDLVGEVFSFLIGSSPFRHGARFERRRAGVILRCGAGVGWSGAELLASEYAKGPFAVERASYER